MSKVIHKIPSVPAVDMAAQIHLQVKNEISATGNAVGLWRTVLQVNSKDGLVYANAVGMAIVGLIRNEPEIMHKALKQRHRVAIRKAAVEVKRVDKDGKPALTFGETGLKANDAPRGAGAGRPIKLDDLASKCRKGYDTEPVKFNDELLKLGLRLIEVNPKTGETL